MSLTDIVSALHTTLAAQAGLVIFLCVFIVIILRLIGKRSSAACRAAAAIPLQDAPIAETAGPRRNHE